MRLLERMNQTVVNQRSFARKRTSQADTEPQCVIGHLAQILNHRLQPGAVSESTDYEKWYHSLAHLAEAESWPGVTEFLQHMEPRVEQLQIRALRVNEVVEATKQLQQQQELVRPPQPIFAMQCWVNEHEWILAVMALSNGHLHVRNLD